MSEKTGSKRWALYTGMAFLVLAVLGYVFRGEILGGLIAWRIGPGENFSAQNVPTPPDYSLAVSWAALPDKPNPSQALPTNPDGSPINIPQTKAGEKTPVFFIHPTSYFGKSNWNQSLEDKDANWIIDERVLRHQASVFNSCCTLYAPRYRQATFFSFMQESSNTEQALALAYADVVDAFESFLKRIPQDQPFILAGHSQGTRHGAQLLAETIAGSELEPRLIAAYLIGFSIRESDLGGISACTRADATGCVVGWNSIEGDGRGIFAGIDNLLCVNPLSWSTDNIYAGHALNTGAIGYATYGAAKEGEDLTAMIVEPAVADAHCKTGQLFVPELRSESFPQRMQGNSMHVYDYSLFHMNIRSNAVARVAAFRKKS